jgi:hypothetical protein
MALTGEDGTNRLLGLVLFIRNEGLGLKQFLAGLFLSFIQTLIRACSFVLDFNILTRNHSSSSMFILIRQTI